MANQIMDKAFEALPILIEIAQEKDRIVHGRLSGKITYGDLARLIDYNPRCMGRVCGFIRDEITNPQNLPLLNCIVVNGKTKFPTEIESGDTVEMAKKKFPSFSKAVYSHQKWNSLKAKFA